MRIAYRTLFTVTLCYGQQDPTVVYVAAPTMEEAIALIRSLPDYPSIIKVEVTTMPHGNGVYVREGEY